MNRRQLLSLPLLITNTSTVRIPVLRVNNIHSRCSQQQVTGFQNQVWNEAVQTFEKNGISLDIVDREGEVGKYPSDRPRFVGLDRTRVNVVVTDRVPMYWDHGRELGGISTIYEGCHLSVASMQLAHGFRIPFFSVNTLVHELLHLFLQDVFTPSGGLWNTHSHESRVDWYATRMWLFRDGAAVRESARQYVRRLPYLSN